MRTWICMLLLLGGISLVVADEKEAPAKSEYDKLEQEYQKAYDAWLEKIRSTTDNEERQKLFAENPSQEFAGKMLELAKKDPKSESAEKALLFVTGRSRSGKNYDEAMALLNKHHAKSKAMGTIALRMIYNLDPDTPARLREIIEATPHKEVKGQATYALASHLMRKNRDGKRNAEIEALYEEVMKNYADVPYGLRGTLGKRAKGALNEIRFLSIGKTAPDIKGEDVDGVKFKLSDYRGKVVVIDFWGDW